MTEKKHYIYGLIDPHTDKIKYIGQTNDHRRRYKQHISSNEETTKGEWIKELRSQGLVPKIVLLDEADSKKEINNQEFRWMYIGRQKGWNLTNQAGMRTEYTGLHGAFQKLIVELDTPGVIERMLLNLITAIIGSIIAYKWSFNLVQTKSMSILFATTVFMFIYLLYTLVTKPSYRTPRSNASLVISGIWIAVTILLILINY